MNEHDSRKTSSLAHHIVRRSVLPALIAPSIACGFYDVVEKTASPRVATARRWSTEEYASHRERNQWTCFDAERDEVPVEPDTRIFAQASFTKQGVFQPEVSRDGARIVEEDGHAVASRAYGRLLCGADPGGAAAIVGIASDEGALYFHTAGKFTYSPSSRQRKYLPSVGARIVVDTSNLVEPDAMKDYEFTVDPKRMFVTVVPHLPGGSVDTERPAYLLDYRYLRMRPNVVVRRLRLRPGR